MPVFLALLAALCSVPAPAQMDNGGLVFGAREIDKLPRSHYSEPLLGDAGWYWQSTRPVEQPVLKVHTKPSFRAVETGAVGRACMERLCVVEAALPEKHPRTATLTFSCGEDTWHEDLKWPAPKPQFRAMWLPVALQHTRVELIVGGKSVASDEVITDAAAPVCVFHVKVPGEPRYVDHGYGLMPSWQLMAYSGQAVQVLAAPRPSGPGQTEVCGRLLAENGTCLQTFRHILPGDGSAAARQSIPTRDLAPGSYRLQLAAILPHGESVVEETKLQIVTPPADTGFGAYRTKLGYTAPVYISRDETRSWDDLWHGSNLDDVVVAFEGGGRFVFWRGTSYVPCWAYNNAWLSYEWFEAEPDSHGAVDCIEPIMDKACEFSRVEILASTPARVVIHWRYGLTDFLGRVINDEWADEYYYLYPDAVGTRKLVAWFRSGWHENQEFLALNRPGNAPHESLDPRAITFMTTDGRTQRPVWPSPFFSLTGWPHVIAKINLPGQPSPFMVVDDDRVEAKVWARPYVEKPGLFNTYLHWPVSRGIRTAWLDSEADWHRPTHSNLVNLVNDPVVRETDHSIWYWLIGQATRERDIREHAAAWLQQAAVTVEGGLFQGYDKAQRAYVLSAQPKATELDLTVTPATPLLNPAFVIEGADPGLSRAECSEQAKIALGRENDGDRLVVFLQGRFDRSFGLQVR